MTLDQNDPQKRRFALEVYLRERKQENPDLDWITAKGLLEKYHDTTYDMSYTTKNDDIAKVLQRVME
jgi:hypothetical protein